MTGMLPNFHDGHFDGLWRGPNKLAKLFLRTVDQKSFSLELEGVQRLALTEVKEENIILDLVLRSADTLTSTDIESAYGLEAGSAQIQRALAAAKEEQLQILEINPSYGAEGTILFKAWKLAPRLPQSRQA